MVGKFLDPGQAFCSNTSTFLQCNITREQQGGYVVLEFIAQGLTRHVAGHDHLTSSAGEGGAQFTQNSFHSADTEIDEKRNRRPKVVEQNGGGFRLGFGDPLVNNDGVKFI